MRFCFVLLLSIVFSRPIDVVIPCIKKDQKMLEHCIAGIRNNCANIRRVIVVSPEKLTDNAEWFEEDKFPFSKESIAKEIDPSIPKDFPRLGWIFQQLIKLYAPSVIPKIGRDVLVLDADTVFLKKVSFFNHDYPLFSFAYGGHPPYFRHINRLLPWLKRPFDNKCGVCHHMIFQKPILDRLFHDIVKQHDADPWKAICRCIDVNEIGASSFSEYDLYFTYVFHKKLGLIRKLNSQDVGGDNIPDFEWYKRRGYHSISYHRVGN